MLAPLALALASLAPIATPTLTKDVIARHVRTRYPASLIGKVDTATFLIDAHATGLVRTPQEAAYARTVFQSMRNDFFGVHSLTPNATEPCHVDLSPVQSANGPNVLEAEPNDTAAWADELRIGDGYLGSISQAFEVDVFAFQISQPARVVIATGPGLTNPLADTTLRLEDEAGALVWFADDSPGNLYAAISLTLMPGRYTVAVGGFFVLQGSYEVTTSATPITPTPVGLGTNRQDAITRLGEVAVYDLQLPVNTRLDIQVLGGFLFDPNLLLRSATGTDIVGNDDAMGLNARILIELPAGSYQLWVQGFLGGIGTFTLNVGGGPTALGNRCGRTYQDNFQSDFEFDLYPVGLTGTPLTLLHADLTPAGMVPTSDPALQVFDRSFRRIAYNDDFPGRLSNIDMPLPPGTYYVLAAPSIGSRPGDYAISLSCSRTVQPTPLTCTTPITATVTRPGQAVAFAKSPRTSIPLELVTDTSPYGITIDPVLTVLDSQGNLIAYDDDGGTGVNAAAGTVVGEDTSYVVLWSYDGVSTGSTDLLVRCPVSFQGSFSLGSTIDLAHLAKAGRLVYGYVAQSLLTTPIACPPLDGWLLLDPFTVFLVYDFVVPASGTMTMSYPVRNDPLLIGESLAVQTIQKDLFTGQTYFTNAQLITIR